MRPPLALLLGYRLLGMRPGAAYRDWTYDDITRRGWIFRRAVPTAVALGVFLGLAAASGTDVRGLVAPVVGVVVLTLLMGRSVQERALRQQGLGRDGQPDAPWLADDAEVRRRNRFAALSTVVLVGGAILLLVLAR